MLNVAKFLERFGQSEPIFNIDGKVTISAQNEGFVLVLDQILQKQDELQKQIETADTCVFTTKSGKLAVKMLCDREVDETETAISYCKNLLIYV